MLDVDYFKPLIGKCFGTVEFGKAIAELEKETGLRLSCQLLDALHPLECESDNPLKRLYKNEKILVISSGDKILTTYRACAPYLEKLDKYPDGDTHYIFPRYHLTKAHDKQLNSFSLYNLSITAHRYLRVIMSFYKSYEGYNRETDTSDILEKTKDQLVSALKLDSFYEPRPKDSEDIQALRVDCRKNYRAVVSQIAKIVIRRAEPYTTTTIDEVIEKALQSRNEELLERIAKNSPIDGPNDEMELTLRYLILALKLTVDDFEKQYNNNSNNPTYESDFKEFDLLTTYLMVIGKFENKKSDGLIIDPNEERLAEFSRVTKEVHGEIAKMSTIFKYQTGGRLIEARANEFLEEYYEGIYLSEEQASALELGLFDLLRLTEEQASALRIDYGYNFMLESRVEKITRCAYYVDKCREALVEHLSTKNTNILGLAEELADLAKLKIYTSVASTNYADAYQAYTAIANRLLIAAHHSRPALSTSDRKAISIFISQVDDMSETKRRNEGSVDSIKQETGKWTKLVVHSPQALNPEKFHIML